MGLQTSCLFAALLAWGLAAHAQTVNRCEGADGKIVYRDTACDRDSKKATELILNTTPATTTSPPESAGSEKKSDLQKKNAEFEERRKARALAEDGQDAEAVKRRQLEAEAKRAAEKEAAEAKAKSEQERKARARREGNW
ncbi:hypothetical protein BH11PSE11_BH11PSE11_17660 [soil metagenome]